MINRARAPRAGLERFKGGSWNRDETSSNGSNTRIPISIDFVDAPIVNGQMNRGLNLNIIRRKEAKWSQEWKAVALILSEKNMKKKKKSILKFLRWIFE